MCRCAPSSRARAQQRRAGGRRRRAAALGRLGAQQRRERRHLHRQVRARERPGESRLEQRARRPARRRGRERVERLARSAPRSGRPRPAVTVASPSRSTRRRRRRRSTGRAGSPSAACGRLADDEAVRHVAHAGGRGRAERARGPACVSPTSASRRAIGGGRSSTSLEVAGEVAGEVVERAAGGRHVDEPEQRGAQLGVLRGELHRLVVERLERVARGRHRRGQPASHRRAARAPGARSSTMAETLRSDALAACAQLAAQRRRARCTTRRTPSRASTSASRAALDGLDVRAGRSSTTARATARGALLAELARGRRAREGRHAVAQLRPPGGAHAPASTTRRGDVVVMLDGDLQDPPELIPEMLEALARRRRRRLRRARVARGGDALQAARPRAGSTACSRRLAASTWRADSGDFRLMDRARARRAARDARAQPLPARDDRLGRLHADRGRRTSATRARRRDEVHAAQDAALRLRRDHELLPRARCRPRRCSASSSRCSRSSRSRSPSSPATRTSTSAACPRRSSSSCCSAASS